MYGHCDCGACETADERAECWANFNTAFGNPVTYVGFEFDGIPVFEPVTP